jgi:anti-sigma B factor antagonist
MSLHVDVRRPEGAADVVILDLAGKLTAGFGDQVLRDSLDELLGEGWRKIVLNLTAVTFMDSAGLGELVAGLKTARNVGADLKVVAAGEGRVRSTISLARLLPLFEVVETDEAALESFR